MLSLFRRSSPAVEPAEMMTIEPMRFADVPIVSCIEEDSFEDPWPHQAFDHAIADSRQRAYVVRREETIIGYAVIHVSAESHQITNLAVVREHRRHGIASKVVGHLQSLLGQKPFMCLYAEVRESNLPAQLFFKKLGFQWISTYRNGHNDREDSYLMQWRVGSHRHLSDSMRQVEG